MVRFLPRAHQLAGGRRVRRLARIGPPVPVAQRREGLGQRVGDHRVVDAAHEHRRQRRQERDADEGHEGQGQPGRAQGGPGHRAGHALKRSFISSRGPGHRAGHALKRSFISPMWPGHRASHALKRSFISSMWSLHHAQSYCRARRAFAGYAGMCGFMSMPVSACVETSGAPERRAGL